MAVAGALDAHKRFLVGDIWVRRQRVVALHDAAVEFTHLVPALGASGAPAALGSS